MHSTLSFFLSWADVRVLIDDDSVFNEAAEGAFEEKNRKDFAAIKITDDDDVDGGDSAGNSQDRFAFNKYIHI